MLNSLTIKKILTFLITISSIQIIYLHTDIKMIEIINPLYANQKTYDYINLKNSYTKSSIIIESGNEIRLNNKRKVYRFISYNQQDKSILVSDRDQYKLVNTDKISSISVKLDYVKSENLIGGILGGIVGGFASFYPSGFLGFIVGSTIDYDGIIGGGTCLAITAGGTMLGAKAGYTLGSKIGNPFIKLSLSGENIWVLTTDLP